VKRSITEPAFMMQGLADSAVGPLPLRIAFAGAPGDGDAATAVLPPSTSPSRARTAGR